MNLEEKTLKENLVFSGTILQLYNDDIVLENGMTSKREYVNHHGGASILAVDDDNNIYLVEQYRYAYRELVKEIPAGKLEKGEDPRECAIRELKEEIGATCTNMTLLSEIYPTPGYTNEHLYIFLATGLNLGQNKLDEGEFLNVIKIPFKKALEMVNSGELKDGKTVIAILKYALLNK